MKKLILLIWILILLTSCYSNSKDLENNIKITQKEVVEDTFSKKLECAKIDINKDIKENWWSFADKYDIEEIFYSQLENTCIWIVTLITDNTRDVWAYNILSKDWFLNKWYDNFWTCSYSNTSEELTKICLEQEEKFNLEIEKLKN